MEDLEGSVNVMVFPREYQLSSTILVEDAVVHREGQGQAGPRRRAQLNGVEITVPDLTTGSTTGPIVISMPAVRVTPPVVDQLKDVLSTHPGVAEVHLKLQSAGRTMVLRLDEGLRRDPVSRADGRPQGTAGSRVPVGYRGSAQDPRVADQGTAPPHRQRAGSRTAAVTPSRSTRSRRQARH